MKRKADSVMDDENRPDMDLTADVPFVIEEGQPEEPAAELPEEDDIPLAVVEEAAQEERRSAWRMLSTDDFPQVSLREILGGDYLIGSFLRRNILFILMLVALGILYITNRYAAQQEIIEHEKLRNELIEKKNYALTQYAELTMFSRQSNIENRLKAFGDSLLTSPKEPPFEIKVDQ